MDCTALDWTRGEREKCVQSDDMQRNYTLYSGLFHATEVVAGSSRHRRTDSLDRWDTVSSQFETFLLLLWLLVPLSLHFGKEEDDDDADCLNDHQCRLLNGV